MRRLLWLPVVALWGCSKTPAPLPSQPGDDPSARTTTIYNPSTPEEMAAKCDVPMYPGATAPDGMSRMPRKDPDGHPVYELVLTTSDKPQKVSLFYTKALQLPVKGASDRLSLVGISPHKNQILLEIEEEGGHTVIRIHSIGPKAT